MSGSQAQLAWGAFRHNISRHMVLRFPHHVACWLVLAHRDELRVPQDFALSPFGELDFGYGLRS